MQETKRHGGRTRQLQGGPVARTNSTSGLPGKQRQPNQDGGAPSVTCTRTRDGAASVKSETPTPAAGAYGAEASVSGPLPASGGWLCAQARLARVRGAPPGRSCVGAAGARSGQAKFRHAALRREMRVADQAA